MAVATGVLTLTIAVTQDESLLWQPAIAEALRCYVASSDANDALPAHGRAHLGGADVVWGFVSVRHGDAS